MKDKCYKWTHYQRFPGKFTSDCSMNQDEMPTMLEKDIMFAQKATTFVRQEEICQIRPFIEENEFGGDNYCELVRKTNLDLINYCNLKNAKFDDLPKVKVDPCPGKYDCSPRDFKSFQELLQPSAQAEFLEKKAIIVECPNKRHK